MYFSGPGEEAGAWTTEPTNHAIHSLYPTLVIGGRISSRLTLSACPPSMRYSLTPPSPPPRLVRQHRVRRSGQLPSGHTGRCHLEVFAPIRAVVDGRAVDIRPGSVRAPRVPFQPHPLAGAGAGASLEEGEVLPLGRRRVLDDHHRPPDRRRIRHVREEGFSSSYTRYFPIDRPRALPHCLWYILTYIDHNIFHRSQFSAVNYFFGLP